MIEFFDVIEGGIPPGRASKSANGTIPTNGFRYCEPVRLANSFGWYVFLPMAFRLVWKGDEILCSVDEGAEWFPLADAVQYPGFSPEFDEHAPAEIEGYSPPFLTRTNDHDIVQIWTGLFAKTPENISLLVRGPANLPSADTYVMEGIVHTDWWFGPLFANVKIRQQGEQIIFRQEKPFLQVQPVDRELLKRMDEQKATVSQGLTSMSEENWQAYHDTVVRRMKTRTNLGQYAVEARKREKGRAP